MSKNGVFGSENACKWGRIAKAMTKINVHSGLFIK